MLKLQILEFLLLLIQKAKALWPFLGDIQLLKLCFGKATNLEKQPPKLIFGAMGMTHSMTHSMTYVFRILIYEVFTYAAQPFKDINRHELITNLNQRKLPHLHSNEIPDGIPPSEMNKQVVNDVWNICDKCLNFEPKERIRFSQISALLFDYIDVITENDSLFMTHSI